MEAKEWISVKDRLPESRRRVLFTYDLKVFMGCYVANFSNEYMERPTWVSIDGGHFMEVMVEFWMPLQELPKQSKPYTTRST